MAPLLLQPRQTIVDSGTIIIPSTYGSRNSGPSPGTVAGIVLGSVAGFLLLLWFLYTCFSGAPLWGTYDEKVVVKEKRRRRRSGHSHAHSAHRVSETVEVRMHEHSQPPPPPPINIVRPPERVQKIVVEESRNVRRERDIRRDGDDEVVVIEDHSPPRKSKSKRDKRDSRDDGGYRTVDPLAYGGVVGGRRA